MARIEDWPERLQDEIDRARDEPYWLGRHDCFIFACACAKAMTGTDYLSRFGGQYSSKRSALKAIREFGGGGAAEAVDKLVGADRRRTTPQARRGDWVLFQDQEGPHLGVCLGLRSAFLAPEGLVFVATRDCLTAWEIS